MRRDDGHPTTAVQPLAANTDIATARGRGSGAARRAAASPALPSQRDHAGRTDWTRAVVEAQRHHHAPGWPARRQTPRRRCGPVRAGARSVDRPRPPAPARAHPWSQRGWQGRTPCVRRSPSVPPGPGRQARRTTTADNLAVTSGRPLPRPGAPCRPHGPGQSRSARAIWCCAAPCWTRTTEGWPCPTLNHRRPGCVAHALPASARRPSRGGATDRGTSWCANVGTRRSSALQPHPSPGDRRCPTTIVGRRA